MEFASAFELKQMAKHALSTKPESRGRTTGGTDARLAFFAREPDQDAPTPIVGLGISRKRGRPGEFQLAVRYRRGEGLATDAALEKLTDLARGEIDLEETGEIRLAGAVTGPQRPCCMGTSIGVDGFNMAGTLGAFVRRADDHGLYILSNNHVLTNENAAPAGTAIVQPGVYDGGSIRERVGELSHWVQIDPAPGSPNLCDAAIARMDQDIGADLTQLKGLGALAGKSDAEARYADGELIDARKIGRTTDLTFGQMVEASMDITVAFAGRNVTFTNQMGLKPANKAFADCGDSGALVVDADLQAIGLLFAVDDNGNGYANHIDSVLDAMHLKLAT